MNKALVIIPTYNERYTLPEVISSVLKHSGFDILVVDDGSPDGTAGFVKELMTAEERVFLMERPGKLGLGTAYIAGFKWGLEKGYGYFIEMDADNSHNPEALPYFLREMERGKDLVIGSRYLNGTINVIGWDFRRLMLSKFGNFYASRILGLRLTDLTSGFRCYAGGALERLGLDKIHSNGYAFQIETAYRAWVAGCRLGEMPITFYERASGVSKMSRDIILEAAALPWRLRLARLFRTSRRAVFSDFKYNVNTALGLLAILTGLAGSVGLGVWLSTEGDLIAIIHNFRMTLPGWAGIVMKIGPALISALLFFAIFFALALAFFSAPAVSEDNARISAD